MRRPRALSIAGSDPSGGAGIQADLRVMAAFGVHGCSVVTAVTTQNSRGVRDVLELSPAVVGAQLDAVLDDIGADAIKTGMLPTAGGVEAVAARLGEGGAPLIVDPVARASSGAELSSSDALRAIRKMLLPRALLVTPNLDEAAALTGEPCDTVERMESAARVLHGFGAGAALVTGGHLEGSPVDVFFDGESVSRLSSGRAPGPSPHGTGCALSAAVAAALASGADLPRAVELARGFVGRAIRFSFRLGEGAPFLDLSTKARTDEGGRPRAGGGDEGGAA